MKGLKLVNTDYLFALIDCNNFFVSCERLFDPRFKSRPAVVLSNNDGCVVARSSEVKKLNVPMAAPFFKVEDIFRKHNVKAFSSNYQLYSDMSQRVMSVLSGHFQSMEIYSIDEAFAVMPVASEEILIKKAMEIRKSVYQSTGIPVSIGIAPTKTLAKLATDIGKKNPLGVYILKNPDKQDFTDHLQALTPKEIWGIGYRNSQKLEKLGYKTALQIKNADPQTMRKKFGVNMYRVITELNGMVTQKVKQDAPLQKGLAYTRSFSQAIYTKDELESALVRYGVNAVQKLRSLNALAGEVYLFARSGVHSKTSEKYYKYVKKRLGKYTDDTLEITGLIHDSMDELYKPGVKFKKAGVWLGKIISKSDVQLDLFSDAGIQLSRESLNSAIDTVNNKWGLETITPASTLYSKKPMGKKELISKRCTTQWNELLKVY
jgi:DNA polymerase V